MKKSVPRQYNIELLRLLAMLSIVMLHMMMHGNVITFVKMENPNFYVSWSLLAPGMYGIDVFLLISGYFMVEQKFRSWSIYKIASQVLFYAIGISVIFWVFMDTPIDKTELIYSVLPVTSDFYWYASMYVGLVIVAPIMNKCIFALTKQQLKCACLVAFMLCSVWPNIAFFSSALNTAGGASISWFMAVYLFGAYIRLYYEPDGNWKKPGAIALGLMILLPLTKFFFEWMCQIGLAGLFEDMLWGYSIFYQYNSILCTAIGVMLLITFLNIKIESQWLGRAINLAASASFGVYLIHDHLYMRQNMWNWVKPYNWLDKWYLFALALAWCVIIYLACMIIELIRQKIFGIWENTETFKGFFAKIDDKLNTMWRAE